MRQRKCAREARTRFKFAERRAQADRGRPSGAGLSNSDRARSRAKFCCNRSGWKHDAGFASALVLILAACIGSSPAVAQKASFDPIAPPAGGGLSFVGGPSTGFVSPMSPDGSTVNGSSQGSGPWVWQVGGRPAFNPCAGVYFQNNGHGAVSTCGGFSSAVPVGGGVEYTASAAGSACSGSCTYWAIINPLQVVTIPCPGGAECSPGPRSENPGFVAVQTGAAYVFANTRNPYTGPYLLPGTTRSTITGFSSDGGVFGGTAYGTTSRPFFVLLGTAKTCDMDPTGVHENYGGTFAYGMDQSGTYMVGTTDLRNLQQAQYGSAASPAPSSAVLWTGVGSPVNCAKPQVLTWKSLGTLLGYAFSPGNDGVPQDTAAYAVAVRETPVGTVIVGSATDKNGNHQATRWTNYNGAESIAQLLVNSGAGVRDLSALTEAVALSDDGTQIAGNGVPVPGGDVGAWHAVLPLPTQPKIDVSASPATGGTVRGAGAFPHNSNRTVTAVPAAGYKFTGWYDFGALAAPYARKVSTSPKYTFKLTLYRRLVATFQPK